jgi:hypothetical protein
MRLWALWGLCALLISPLPAQAEFNGFRNGQQLLSECAQALSARDRPGSVRGLDADEISACLNYIEGAVDVLRRFKRICISEDATSLGLLLDVVVDYLLRTPTRAYLQASSLVEQALAEAFPCSK